MPNFYFDAQSKVKKYCKTFRDCKELYRFACLRVTSLALETFLDFCRYSLYVDIAVNGNKSVHDDLEWEAGKPKLLSESERDAVKVVVAEKGNMYTCSVKYKYILFKYDKNSSSFVEMKDTYKPLTGARAYMSLSTVKLDRFTDDVIVFLHSSKTITDIQSRINTPSAEGQSYSLFGYTFHNSGFQFERDRTKLITSVLDRTFPSTKLPVFELYK